MALWTGERAMSGHLRRQHVIILYLLLVLVDTFNSTPLPPPLGMYVTFPFPANDCTIALLASIFRNAMNASPAFWRAAEMVAAASDSPSARITAA